MTDTCPECGVSLLSGHVMASEQYMNRPVVSSTHYGQIELTSRVCWKCGYSRISVDLELLRKAWFRKLAKTMWEIGQDWFKSPVRFEESLATIARTGSVPKEFLEHHIDAFIEWINNPFNLFAYAIGGEYVGRERVERECQGLIFRKTSIEDDLGIVLEDTRIINKL